MIFGKIWRAIKAQFNKLANFFWTADPIAQMQYEYDTAVEEMKSGRQGLEQYRALVERVTRQGDDHHERQYVDARDRQHAEQHSSENESGHRSTVT